MRIFTLIGYVLVLLCVIGGAWVLTGRLLHTRAAALAAQASAPVQTSPAPEECGEYYERAKKSDYQMSQAYSLLFIACEVKRDHDGR